MGHLLLPIVSHPSPRFTIPHAKHVNRDVDLRSLPNERKYHAERISRGPDLDEIQKDRAREDLRNLRRMTVWEQIDLMTRLLQQNKSTLTVEEYAPSNGSWLKEHYKHWDFYAHLHRDHAFWAVELLEQTAVDMPLDLSGYEGFQGCARCSQYKASSKNQESPTTSSSSSSTTERSPKRQRT